MQNLVIVESPTKARTLSKYLGDKYQIEASYGHVRDLPKGDLGIDVEHDFAPKYVIPKLKTKRVNELKKLAEKAKVLWLASDPDREGEAIAWHLSELLCNSEVKSDGEGVKRVVFHEITKEAIEEAFKNPCDLDLKLVDAQQARRVLDRLVGYKLSPLLWKKIQGGLSAGRVQSVALRLIVEKEAEVKAFKPVEYWSIEAELITTDPAQASVGSPAHLLTNASVLRSPVAPSDTVACGDSKARSVRGQPPSAGSPGSLTASLIELNGKKLEIKIKDEADLHLKALEGAEYKVSKVTKREVRKTPPPPFTTSTLQQTSSNRLGYSAKKTMSLAQILYEHGLITYMRTDSVNLSTQALASARNFIEQNIGKAYLPQTARIFKTQSKLAQEAHEAIRPTDIEHQMLDAGSQNGLTRDHTRLYELIWKRMLASQMSEALMDQTSIDITARDPSLAAQDESHCYLFRATGSVIRFDGWLKVYGKSQDEEEEESGKILPELTQNEVLKLLQLLPNQHFTEPPARFTEASLIKKLEELGIGRPSTYAPIISTILERYYVEKKEKKFFPTELGIGVIKFLMKYFADVFDYSFTAEMENEFDNIADGKSKWQPVIKKFYEPFEKKLETVEEKAEKVKIETEKIDKKCPKCGKPLQIKFGRFGKFLACTGFPDCKHTENIEQKIDVKCPDCGGDILFRKTRKGRPFYGCKNYPKCKFASWTKPKEGAKALIDNTAKNL
ncbi:MAG: topoisomerase protein [Candidatus Daviesbacteria bacterium GW2011_GWB1_41_5]|uniref:DNA topoisomerase 1 n=1 Tax=Candidatus Daviesbacteria bacterium GW2011_GWB1_41_5 TaxID=1618429 RepID=A0A0G0WQJ8_9BACT|nr:MAG: topoisomerase protein [Candidatus Daviesbacteria bacterium GW2011_GWB1_41_5]